MSSVFSSARLSCPLPRRRVSRRVPHDYLPTPLRYLLPHLALLAELLGLRHAAELADERYFSTRIQDQECRKTYKIFLLCLRFTLVNKNILIVREKLLDVSVDLPFHTFDRFAVFNAVAQKPFARVRQKVFCFAVALLDVQNFRTHSVVPPPRNVILLFGREKEKVRMASSMQLFLTRETQKPLTC